jgi:cytochrome c
MRAGNIIFKTVIVCGAAFVAVAQSPAPNGEKLVTGNDCTGCHSPDSQGAGPSWKAIAKRYAGQAGAPAKLSAKIRAGGSGTWGDVAMTPHPDVTDAQGRQMVDWILSLKDAAPSAPAAPSKTYSYKPKNGPAVQLDFSIFVTGTSGKVTKDIFRGYELFNSYCYRCHGTDASGSELGPDLRHSLAAGMTQQQFIAIAMAGRKDKGMPSWAGFLSKQEVTQTYQYTKGRSLDLIAPGRPPE